MRIERLTHAADGTPLDFEYLYYRGDAFSTVCASIATAPVARIVTRTGRANHEHGRDQHHQNRVRHRGGRRRHRRADGGNQGEGEQSGCASCCWKKPTWRSGAISMGMDGLNNAVIPGHATPEQYTKEITIANDGIVNQATVYAYARHSFTTIEQLDRWGVRYEKDETGDYAVKKVHHMGSYVLPMPQGHDIKKVLYRQLKRARIAISNRIVSTRLLTDAGGAVSGVLGFDCRTAEFHVVRAKAVILCCGAAGRLGLPASGYLMGTYENPTTAGDGYAMAYHAGAELANLECFQINPLIKDYNGPACAYVTGPLGGYTANNKGERFIECDYWSGQMMWEFYQELQGGNGPVFLKLDHLAEEAIQNIEHILHSNERPSRGQFHANRGTDYRRQMVEMHISEIGFCSDTALRASGSMNARKPRYRASMPPATWLRCRTTTCSVPSPTAGSPARTRRATSPAKHCRQWMARRWRAARHAPAAQENRACRQRRSNTSCAASSTTTCSRPRSPARWKSACNASPRSRPTSRR